MTQVRVGLSIRELLKEVYSDLLKGESENLKFKGYGFSMVVFDDGDPHKSTQYTFRYKEGKRVKVNGTDWILSRGDGGSGESGFDSDIIAIPSKDPEDIERCLRFSHSMIIAKTDGSFLIQPPYNKFKKPAQELLKSIDWKTYINSKRVVDNENGYIDPNTFGPAVRGAFTYKRDLVPVLGRGLEEMLTKADAAELREMLF